MDRALDRLSQTWNEARGGSRGKKRWPSRAKIDFETEQPPNRLRALLYKDVHYAEKASHKDAAVEALRQELEAGEVGEKDGTPIFTNQEGRACLEELDEMRTHLRAMKKDLASLQRKGLDVSRIRQRCLSVYKREFLPGHMDDTDKWAILTGNQVAHAGNAYHDAELYFEGARSDRWVFEKVYGVTVEEGYRWNERITNEVVQFHANITFNKGYFPQEAEVAFQKWLALARKYDGSCEAQEVRVAYAALIPELVRLDHQADEERKQRERQHTK